MTEFASLEIALNEHEASYLGPANARKARAIEELGAKVERMELENVAMRRQIENIKD